MHIIFLVLNYVKDTSVMFDDNISTTSLPLNPLSYSPYSIIYGIQESFLGVCDAAMLEFVAPEPLNVKRWRCNWMRSRCNHDLQTSTGDRFNKLQKSPEHSI